MTIEKFGITQSDTDKNKEQCKRANDAHEKFKGFMSELSEKEGVKTKKEVKAIVDKLKDEISYMSADQALKNVPEKYKEAPEITEILNREIVDILKNENSGSSCFYLLKIIENSKITEDYLREHGFLNAIQEKFKKAMQSWSSDSVELAINLAKRINFSKDFLSSQDLQTIAKKSLSTAVSNGDIFLVETIIRIFALKPDEITDLIEKAIKEGLHGGYFDSKIENLFEILDKNKIPKSFIDSPLFKQIVDTRFSKNLSGSPEISLSISKAFSFSGEHKFALAAESFKNILIWNEIIDSVNLMEKIELSKEEIKKILLDSIPRFLKNLNVIKVLDIKEKTGLSEEEVSEIGEAFLKENVLIGEIDKALFVAKGLNLDYKNSPQIQETISKQFEKSLSGEEPDIKTAMKISSSFNLPDEMSIRLLSYPGIGEVAKEELASAMSSDDRELTKKLIERYGLSKEILKTEKFFNEDEQILGEREVVSFGNLKGGANESSFVNLLDDGSGVFKPVKGEVDLRKAVEKGTFYRRERAAYLVDNFLEFGLVPPTVIKESEGTVGSIQRFIPDAKAGIELVEPEKDIKEQLKVLWVFDCLVYNSDRHSGNWIVSKNKVYAIDNGLCFGDDYLRSADKFFDIDFSPDIINKLENFSSDAEKQDKLKELLIELLPEKEVDAFFKRFERLVKLIREFKGKIPSFVQSEVSKFK